MGHEEAIQSAKEGIETTMALSMQVWDERAIEVLDSGTASRELRPEAWEGIAVYVLLRRRMALLTEFVEILSREDIDTDEAAQERLNEVSAMGVAGDVAMLNLGFEATPGMKAEVEAAVMGASGSVADEAEEFLKGYL